MKALREGQYVKHFQYGFGWVTESDDERTSIDFNEHGPKKFVTSLMVVELAGDPPPRPSRTRRRKKLPVAAAAAKTAERVSAGKS